MHLMWYPLTKPKKVKKINDLHNGTNKGQFLEPFRSYVFWLVFHSLVPGNRSNSSDWKCGWGEFGPCTRVYVKWVHEKFLYQALNTTRKPFTKWNIMERIRMVASAIVGSCWKSISSQQLWSLWAYLSLVGGKRRNSSDWKCEAGQLDSGAGIHVSEDHGPKNTDLYGSSSYTHRYT